MEIIGINNPSYESKYGSKALQRKYTINKEPVETNKKAASPNKILSSLATIALTAGAGFAAFKGRSHIVKGFNFVREKIGNLDLKGKFSSAITRVRQKEIGKKISSQFGSLWKSIQSKFTKKA